MTDKNRTDNRADKNRTELLKDAEYFANELSKRCEALAKAEAKGHLIPTWQQAAKLTRQIRGLCRQQKDANARKLKLV